MARKTSSSVGACSCRSAIAMPSASSARTISASSLAALGSRAAARTGRSRRARSPKRSSTAAQPLAVARVARRRPRRVGPADLGLQLGRRALGDDPAVVDDPDAVGEHVRLLEVLGGQEDGHPLVGASRPTSSQSAVRLWMSRPVVGSSRNRMRGPVHEREREVEAPLHAARVAADLAVGGLGEADPLEQLAARAVWRSDLPRPCSALCRRMCSRPVRSGSSADSCSAAPIAARTCGPCLTTSKPATRARARGRRQQRGQHQHRGRLAGAVGAEEAVDLARRDLEVDAVDRARPVLELAHEPFGTLGAADTWRLRRESSTPPVHSVRCWLGFLPGRCVRVHRPSELPLFPQHADFHSEVDDTVLDVAVLPAFRFGARVFSWFRVFQQGTSGRCCTSSSL